MNNKSKLGDISTAAVTRNAGADETVGMQGFYEVICYDKNGNVKWQDKAPNLVTAAGKQALFDYYFGATGTGGGTSAGANYLGLVTSATATANYFQSDTMSSHAGWYEPPASVAAARQAPNWTAASNGGQASPSNVVSKAAGALTFSMLATATIFGCFINSGASASLTVSGTGGVLYSAGNFTGGSKTVANGDSLAVTYTTTATS
jgi:hypothetical protein